LLQPISEKWTQIHTVEEAKSKKSTQKWTQNDSTAKKSKHDRSPQAENSEEVEKKAGEGIRTLDVQLGNDPEPNHNSLKNKAQEPPEKEDGD